MGKKKKESFPVEPFDDWVVVLNTGVEEVTPGGIVVPREAQEEKPIFEVYAVGPGRLFGSGERRPVKVKVGDKVLIRGTIGAEFEYQGRRYFVIQEGDVVARLLEE